MTGARGSSGVGYAGPAGPTGPAGARGPTGVPGERGDTLVGPAGAAGRAGPAGERGEAGQTGRTGETTSGVAGAVGPAGPAGPMGQAGQIGPVGPTGMIEQWASYREFWFDQDRDTIHNSDLFQLEQIASYMRNNPSLELGLDSSVSGSSRSNQYLTESRVRAVRSGLIAAGVSADRISEATVAPAVRREDRIAVMLRTMRGYTGSSSAYNDRIGSEDRSTTMSDWTTYHTFSFDGEDTSTHPADRERFDQIVSFMQRNPNMRLGISSSQQDDPALAPRRSNIVRDALIDAGVDGSRISIGQFGNGQLTRNGRLEVLVMTDRSGSQSW